LFRCEGVATDTGGLNRFFGALGEGVCSLHVTQHVEDGGRRGEENRAEDDAERSERLQPAEHGDEHGQPAQPHTAGYQSRPQQVVDAADDRRSPHRQHDRLWPGAGREQVQGPGHPDGGRADERHHAREDRHQTPQGRGWNTEQPEHASAEDSLDSRDRHDPVHAGVHDLPDPKEQCFASRSLEGKQIEDRRDQRLAVTKKEEDRYKFRVPMLRNVAKTAPYFHDGSVESLERAVQVMAATQLGQAMDEATAADIAAFLGSLTGAQPAHFAPPAR